MRLLPELRLSRKAFSTFIAAQPPALVLFEACGTAHFWGRTAHALGHEVRLLPAQYTFREIESQVRPLSEPERARLALTLIESLENQDHGDVAQDWRVEIERRWSEIKSGAAVTVSASEVFAEVHHSLK